MRKTLTPIPPAGGMPSGLPTATLVLPDNLLWPDELHDSPVQQSTQRAIDGSLHVDAQVRHAGRRVVLSGDEGCWIARRDLRVLQQWASVPLLRLTLWWGEASLRVLFDIGESGAVTSQPVYPFSDPDEDCWHHQLAIRLLTI